MLNSSKLINNARVVPQMDGQTYRQTKKQADRHGNNYLCPEVCGDIRLGAHILARDHNTS